MAHKKGGGSSKNGRDSHSKRLGVKVYDGMPIRAGGIILRQRGARWVEKFNVGTGRDFTLYARIDGIVKFEPGQHVSVYTPEKYAAIASRKKAEPEKSKS